MRKTNSSNSLHLLVKEFKRNSSSTFDFNFGAQANDGFQTAIELDTDAFETFVTETLSDHIDQSSDAVFKNLRDQVKRLYQHASSQSHRLCKHQAKRSCSHCSNSELAEIALSLKSVIEMSPKMPARVTAEVHSLIGLLNQNEGNLKGAIQSFLKALWIQSSLVVGAADDEDDDDDDYDLPLQMALTRHRLGFTYGKSGEFAEAATILDKAVQDYQAIQADTEMHRKLLEHAKTELGKFLEASEIEANLPGISSKKANRRRTRRGADLTDRTHVIRRSNTEKPASRPPLSGSDLRRSSTEKPSSISRSFNSLAAFARGRSNTSSSGSEGKTNFQW